MSNIIDRLYEDHKALSAFLTENGQISLLSNAADNFRKTLLLSAASYFESIIKDSIIAIVAEHTGPENPILEFLKNKAIERQYHTYFQWNSSNANSFFGLFGSDFKDYMTSYVKKDSKLKESISAFIELGELRNQLVHQNFAIFPLEKDAEEIYQLYVKASLFVEIFPDELGKFIESNSERDR